MLSSLFMAAFAAQVADDGFSKLQIFLQQLIDWGVSAGGRIIGACHHLCGRTVLDFPFFGKCWRGYWQKDMWMPVSRAL